jgi:hypothetical protein
VFSVEVDGGRGLSTNWALSFTQNGTLALAVSILLSHRHESYTLSTISQTHARSYVRTYSADVVLWQANTTSPLTSSLVQTLQGLSESTDTSSRREHM